MTMQVHARFENGVFVPDTKVDLPEHKDVILRIDVADSVAAAEVDPRPAGGPELIQWRGRHRIEIDPEIARQIAEDPEFDIENS